MERLLIQLAEGQQALVEAVGDLRQESTLTRGRIEDIARQAKADNISTGNYYRSRGTPPPADAAAEGK